MSNIIKKINSNLLKMDKFNLNDKNIKTNSNNSISSNINNNTIETEPLTTNTKESSTSTNSKKTQSTKQKLMTYQEIQEIMDSHKISQETISMIIPNGTDMILETIYGERIVFKDKKLVDVLDSNGNSIVKKIDMYSDEADEYGLYGGDQGNLMNNSDIYISDEIIESIIQNYYPNSNLSPQDLKLLFSKMNEVGCSYIAFVNTVFEGTKFLTDEEFYNKFGFDRYNIVATYDGNYVKAYNYDYMFLDYFLYYQKNFENFTSISGIYGNISANSQDGAITGDTSEGTDGAHLSDAAKVGAEYLKNKEINVTTDNIFGDRDNFAKTVIDMYSPLNNSYIQKIKKALDNGKQVIIAMDEFSLYSTEDIDGNGKLDDISENNVGAHAMIITGVTDDGNFIVSSWGSKYIVKPDATSIYQKISNLQNKEDKNTLYEITIYDYPETTTIPTLPPAPERP